MRIDRPKISREVARRLWTDEVDLEASWAHLGEQYEFALMTRQIYRALAAPEVPNPILRLERATAISYWSSLLSLLIYSFGWDRPDRGLAWWYFGERLTDDPRFDLLSQVWLADGRLDQFVAYLIRSEGAAQFVRGELAELAELGGPRSPAQDVPRGGVAPDGFADRVEAAMLAAGGYDGLGPLNRDSDPLHLSTHLDVPLRRESAEVRGTLLLHDPSGSRRAVLTTGSMVGWYRHLCELGAGLPDLGGHSWHVDVHVRPVGFLGTFRRSRVSGRWFSGPHRYHIIGIGGPDLPGT